MAAALSSLFGGYLNEWFGRRIVILIASAVFTLGAVIMAITHSKEILLLGRLVVGVGVGNSQKIEFIRFNSLSILIRAESKMFKRHLPLFC